MKFFRLIDDLYTPGQTVNNFKSLVWTERFRAPGEFKLEVENDTNVLNTLPLGCLVSHTDTYEVMIVENHEVFRGDKHFLQVAITGRSFEVFAEVRTTAGSEQPLVDGTGATIVEAIAAAPPSTIAVQLLQGRMQPGIASSANAIPNLVISENIRVPDTAMAAVIRRGDLYSQVDQLLAIANAGYKNVRPNGAQTSLNMLVHDGADNRSVIFYALNEDLTDCKYFYSIQNYRNYAAIATNTTNRVYRTKNLAADVTGRQRRSMYVEASDLKGTYSPPTATDVVAQRAQAELDQVPQLYLMEAKVTETAKPKFKIHYDVGDIVTVLGEYESAETMRVTEHIYTYDDKGMHGYPTLSAL